MTVPSLHQGLSLIGKGRVTAIFGRLRAGAGVIDLDTKSAGMGEYLAPEIADWLRRQGCWVLERPSGGAPGRAHIFFARVDFRYAAADHRSGFALEVSKYLELLADDVNIARSELDLRDSVRPLSSPHRWGTVTKPRGDLRDALRRLKQVFPEAPTLQPLRSPKKRAAAGGVWSGAVTPLQLQRYKREIAPQWRRYLTTGDTSALGSYKPRSNDRSLPELGLTRELVWAIGDPKVAWGLIRESHPAAMQKAKHQRPDWWLKYVWNKCVEDAKAFSPTAEASTPPQAAPGVAAAVQAARVRLEERMWTQSARSRASLLLVGHHVLDRMLTAGSLRVPCPERDLVKSTGLADRKTIRAALRLLDGSVGRLHTDCFSPLKPDATSFEFEVEPSEDCSEIPPLSFHPPHAPGGLWATLPRASHSLWRTLLVAEEHLSPSDLAVKAGLVETRDAAPTRSHLAAVKKAAVALAHAGLARVDEDGRWFAATGPRSMKVQERAQQAYAVLDARVEAERAAYREGMASTWPLERARALKAQKDKEAAWWSSLSPAERVSRQEEWRSSFDELSITEQAERKAKLATARANAGIDEVEHYRSWVESLSPDEFARRSEERKARFKVLSQNERGLAVAAWSRHRAAFGLPSPTASWAAERSALPNGVDERDQSFLERQLQLAFPGENPARAAG
ncbi:hypothetical protein ASG90_20915 [Nocardioides sp. Soil797]|nr:hypothetical protein ASG90_20915 [Nocardioides sp. Soil797]